MTDLNNNELLHLEHEKDNLINEVRTMAQNNLNMRYELKRDKSNLIKLVLSAKKVRKTIDQQSDKVKRIVRELKTILDSYCSHLEFLEQDADKDCELDWKMVQVGETDNYQNFLENFLDHRKDYHLFRTKAKRLSSDLCLLDNILEDDDEFSEIFDSP